MFPLGTIMGAATGGDGDDASPTPKMEGGRLPQLIFVYAWNLDAQNNFNCFRYGYVCRYL